MKTERTRKAFEFLRSREGELFKLQELCDATGWKEATVKTCLVKKWSHLVTKWLDDSYRVRGISDLALTDFIQLQSQVYHPPRKPTARAQTYDYDVALSFAGEDRPYVEDLASFLREIGIKVFYDRYEEVDLWGKDLYSHLDDVYRNKARYCVMFISEHYQRKLWTNRERESAQARAFRERSEYILPVRFDDTEIPGITPTTGYLDARGRSPEDIGYTIAKKLGRNVELDKTLEYLRDALPSYEINLAGTEIAFKCEEEEYYGEFPARLMIEMFRTGMIDFMFVRPAIVPN